MPVQKWIRAKLRRLTLLIVVLGLLTSGVVATQVVTSAPAHADASAPAWWHGTTCDTYNYPGSYPLGASYDGVQACGPGTYNQGGTDHSVNFFSGAWGEYEWECVELVMRYMYLVYGIAPYSAPGGKDVYGNYPSTDTQLTKVLNNGSSLPSPGDIISVAAAPVNPTTGVSPNPYGHTAVVTGYNYSGSTITSIEVMQQNATSNGWGSLAVSGNAVTGTVLGGSVIGWLHDPNAGSGGSGNGPSDAVSLISDNGAVWAQSGLVTNGAWTSETGANSAQTISSGDGIQVLKDDCDAIWAQSSIADGQWVQEAGCNATQNVIVSSTGLQMELDDCGAIWAKQSVGNGGWIPETGCNAATKIAVGGNTMAWVNDCGAIWAQNGLTVNTFSQETGCNSAQSIAVGAGGTQVWMDDCDAVWAQNSIAYGIADNLAGCYAGNSVTIGNGDIVILNGCGALWARSNANLGTYGGFSAETGCGSATAVSVGAEDNQFLIGDDGSVWARTGLGTSWAEQAGSSSAVAISAG